MFKKIDKNANRVKRHLRIRKNLTGTSEKPRLCVFKSNTNIYAQLIDDVNHNTLVAASTLDKDFSGESKSNKEAAKLVGELIGKKAKQGKKLVLNLGYSHTIEKEDPEGISVEVPEQHTLIISGINKQQVGNYAAKIRDLRGPEPYKGKGIRYEDEHIRRKVGKTGK